MARLPHRPGTPGARTDDVNQQIIDRQFVLTAVRTLSLEHKQVLLECYFRGTSVAEAAETLSVPPGTIKVRTHDALHALHDAMRHGRGAAGGGRTTSAAAVRRSDATDVREETSS